MFGDGSHGIRAYHRSGVVSMILTVDNRPNRVTTSWLFVTFGEHQAMAQLIAKRVLISPLINKDFQSATLSSLVVVLLP